MVDSPKHLFAMSLPPPPTKAPIASAFISPPPLPEFYLHNQDDENKNETDSSTASEATITHTLVSTTEQIKRSKNNSSTTREKKHIALAQLPPILGNATDEFFLVDKATRVRPSAYRAGNNIPPLAIYHICRICLHPRSARYHREHPIPMNAVPPPPGICRRCRIVKVEEDSTKAEAVRKQEHSCPDLILRRESNDIRFGVATLVPDEDYIGGQEMKERRGRHLLRERKRSRYQEESDEIDDTAEKREITYRHIKVRERRVSPSPKAVASPSELRSGSLQSTLTPRPNITSTAQDAIDAANICSQGHMMTSVAATRTPVPNPPAEAKACSSIARSTGGAELAELTGKDALASLYSSPRRSYSKKSTRAYFEQDFQRVPSESDIRRIARQEVERYRQAERKLEAHPDPYAHGRLIPIERCIEKVQDRAESRPWRPVTEEIEPRRLDRLAYMTRLSSKANITRNKGQSSKLDESSVLRHKSQELEESTSSTRPLQRSKVHTEYFAKSDNSKRPDSHSQMNLRNICKGEVPELSEKDQSHSESKRNRRPSTNVSGSNVAEARSMRSERSRLSDLQMLPSRMVETRDKRTSSQVPKSNIAGPRSTFSEKRMWDNIDSTSSTTNHRGKEPQVSMKLCDFVSLDGKVRQRNEERNGGAGPSRYAVTEVNEDDGLLLDLEQSKGIFRTNGRISDKVQRLREDYDRQERVDEAISSFSSRKSMTSHLPTASKYWQEDTSMKTANSRSLRSHNEVTTYHRESMRNGTVLGQPMRSDGSMISGQNEIQETSLASAEKELLRSWLSNESAVSNKSRHNSEKCQVREPDNHSPAASSERRAFDPRLATGMAKQLPEEEQEKHEFGNERNELSNCRSFAPSTSRPSERAAKTALDDLPNEYWQDIGFSKHRRQVAPSFSAPSGCTAPDSEYIHIERIIRPADESFDIREYNDIPAEYQREAEEYLNWGHHAEIRANRFTHPQTQEHPGEQHQGTKVSPSQSSTRVRFASKIDVSPTPPGSDASSTQFHNIGGRLGTKQRIKEPVENTEDLIAEYECRGRARERGRRKGRQTTEDSQTEYFDGFTEIIPQDRGPNRATKLESERDGDLRYRPRRSQPIMKALSESPSRETLSEANRSRHSDGAGPYRPEEPRRESMEVHDGSGHGRRIGKLEGTYSG